MKEEEKALRLNPNTKKNGKKEKKAKNKKTRKKDRAPPQKVYEPARRPKLT